MQPCKVYANFKTELEAKSSADKALTLKPTVKRHRSITNETELLIGNEFPVSSLKRANSLNS